MEQVVLDVFEYWQLARRTALGLTRSVSMKLTKKRETKIRGRIQEGYSYEDLKRAIDGCMASKFHRDGGTVILASHGTQPQQHADLVMNLDGGRIIS